LTFRKNRNTTSRHPRSIPTRRSSDLMARDLVNDVDVVVLANNYASGMVGTVGHDLLNVARGRAAAPPPWRADLKSDSLASRRWIDRKSTRLNSSHVSISYAVFCLKKY